MAYSKRFCDSVFCLILNIAFDLLFVGSISSELSSVDNLFEDLHWLLLISGYLLADESNGETPLIPQEIISYSSSLKSQVDIQATFQTLCASQNQNQGKCFNGGIR